MTHGRPRRGGRPAFTLIEMLVVIAIIAVLVSLLSAAVVRALIKGPEIQTVTEINDFNRSLSAAQRGFNTKILPSHLRLREDNNYTSGNAAIQAEYTTTKRFLQQIFGTHVTDKGVQIDWNGDGKIENTDLVLEGEQCLVFWLGGKPQVGGTSVGMIGFPLQAGGAPIPAGSPVAPIGPFYEFKAARLKMVQSPDPLNGNAPSLPFPVYTDAWGTGQPYAYFASYQLEGSGSYQGDCPSLAPLTPYMEPSGKWVNGGSFQIISAGRDGKFGAGGKNWNPASGTTDPNGRDDQANFSPHLLGAPAN